MRIVNHRLEADQGETVLRRDTPNVGGGSTPRYLVIHYTAGRDFSSSVDWLTNPAADASAHLVIGRSGEVAQLAPFNQTAWHAGVSRWRGLTGMNAHSIGIELDNAGPLEPTAGGAWVAWFGGRYTLDEVARASHKHGSEYQYWHAYSDAQIERAIIVAGLIIKTYGLLDVIGHDDISPGRKLDPGPAFPMSAFRGRVMGRREDQLPRGRVDTDLNLRAGPGIAFDKLGLLKEGTDVVIRAESGNWLAVDELANGTLQMSGWVHGDYVSPV